MKTYNTKYISIEELTSFASNNQILPSQNILLQIFTGIVQKEYIEKLISDIKGLFPNIKIIGTTTSGEIFEGTTYKESTILSFSIFDKTQITTYSTKHIENSYKTAQNLISQFQDLPHQKVAISFADGLHINGEEFIQAFDKYSEELIISGGLAGDNAQFEQTLVFTEDGIADNGAVVALLCSEDLIVNTKASFGWENIGKTMTITKSDKNIVYEIDGISATDIYAKYLGEEIKNSLPKTGIEFPLIIKKQGINIPRAVVNINEDGSLVFAGNLNIGDKVTFGYGNIQSIIAYGKDVYDDEDMQKSESIFIYSCMAREALMQSDIYEELEPLSHICSVSGFFTYGEFYSQKDLSTKELLNQTMTILSLSENENNKKINKEVPRIEKEEGNTTLKALSHLIAQTSLELEEINNSLEEKVKNEINKNNKKEKVLQQQTRLAQMGEMISMIAHQWRQPLGAISSSIISMQIKKSSGKFNLDEKADRESYFEFCDKRYKNISEYVQFLTATIDDFRNFFKPDKEKEKVALTIPIQRALKIVGVSMKNKGIDLTTDFQTNKELIMYQNEIMQVILNILKNSEDNFVEKNITNPQIVIKTIQKDEEYIINITDNGGGIPEGILGNIFNPYFSTKSEKNGTGLGLYMSKTMIEEHHKGKLKATNVDDGVCFEIILNNNDKGTNDFMH